MKKVLLILLIPLLLFGATKYYLPVQIESSNGRPIRDATVAIYDSTGTVKKADCYWQTSGIYYFTTSLPAGKYDIKIYTSGEWITLFDDIQIIPNILTAQSDVVHDSLMITISGKSINIRDHIQNNNIVNVKDYGAVGDGTTNDIEAIQEAINNNDFTYLIDTSIVINSNNKILIGNKNTIIKQNGSYDIIEINADSVYIAFLELKSNGAQSGNAYYGIDINGSYNIIEKVCVHDISYTAFFVRGSYNIIRDCIAYDVGWDMVSNYSSSPPYPQYNLFKNLKVFRPHRHGFSTDPGSNHIYFINCYAEDVGSPVLNEGHSAFHFEESDYGKVINCISKYTANHPLKDSTNGTYIPGVRVEKSHGIKIDGLTIEIDSSFTLSSEEDLYWIYVNTVSGDTIDVVINNLNIINESDYVLKSYIGALSYLNIAYSRFYGKITFYQASTNTWIKSFCHNYVNGVDKSCDFLYMKYNLKNCLIEDNVFKNLKWAIKGGQIENTIIKNNEFLNNKGNIYLDFQYSNSSRKSQYNHISYNRFINCDTLIYVGWQIYATQHKNYFNYNIIEGNYDIILKTGNPGSLIWQYNIPISLNYNELINGSSDITLNSDLRSEYDGGFPYRWDIKPTTGDSLRLIIINPIDSSKDTTDYFIELH